MSFPAKLPPKQQRFVEEYLIDLNATQAAIWAGYSTKTLQVQGVELLKKPVVATAIVEAKAARSERTEITQDLSGHSTRVIIQTSVDRYEFGPLRVFPQRPVEPESYSPDFSHPSGN